MATTDKQEEEGPLTVAEVDLTPLPGKKYFDILRDWREGFIYFLMVDRFHDNKPRQPVTGSERSFGSGTSAQLSKSCGGNLKGIASHLDYIHKLGCTAIWLSPVFENDQTNPGSYHGYGIINYLKIDPRFGNKQDLVELVEEAHKRNMRVFLDVVLNHAGDVYGYEDDKEMLYNEDEQFPLGFWRQENRPAPLELRDPKMFGRRGQIRNWDAYPEYDHGDFMSLKSFAHNDPEVRDKLIEILIKAHCYWIRETDIDGFRLDAIKHMGSRATARFCTHVREYAYFLGKRTFFMFGELIGDDNAINHFMGPHPGDSFEMVYSGIESVLDFPLSFVLPDLLKGKNDPSGIFSRYAEIYKRAALLGDVGRHLVTFVDNHDGVGQGIKERFGADSTDEQTIAAHGFILCALGTPCIYYGSEQGFGGHGDGDKFLREAMFDLTDHAKDYLNPECNIFKEIAKIAAIRKENKVLVFGRMYMRSVSGDGVNFGPPESQPCTIAFSRILAYQEILVAYNTSTTDYREDYILISKEVHEVIDQHRLTYLYGRRPEDPESVPVQIKEELCYVQLRLAPMQFVILF